MDSPNLFVILLKAYLYDIRGNTFCHRLTGHTDVVYDVAFHPAEPQVS